MPLRVTNYLEAYSLAKGVSKSRILASLIETWMTNQEVDGQTENALLITIARRASKEWQIRKKKYPFIKSNDYKSGLTREFRKKGLSNSQITTILDKIRWNEQKR